MINSTMSNKLTICIILTTYLSFSACDPDNKKMKEVIPSPVGLLQGNMVPQTDSGVSSGKPAEGLEKEIPLSNDKIKDLLPEKIGLYNRTKMMSGHTESLGFAGIQALYQHFPGAEKSISIEITDGAGITGAVMVNAAEQRLKMDFEEKNSIGYTRIFEKEGLRVREKENTFDSYAEIEFVFQKRFIVLFRAQKTPMHELWEFISQAGFLTTY